MNLGQDDHAMSFRISRNAALIGSISVPDKCPLSVATAIWRLLVHAMQVH
jgi:hypothetical protein